MEHPEGQIATKEAADSCLLEADSISKAFKGLLAVDGYSVRLCQGAILGIIGPNGAGKSTVLNLLTGYIHPTHGTIRFQGREIVHLPPDEIPRMGIGRTFQNVRLFPSMTILDNVKAAVQLHDRDSLLTTLLSWPSFLERERRLTERSLELLALFNLAGRAGMPSVSLSYGDQRQLEIVRALALRPKLLLLDEPVAGLNPSESQNMLQLIRHVHDVFNLTIIIIEHNMPLIMQLCERIQVLNYGRIIAEGTPEQIRRNPLVVEAYLGKEGTDATESPHSCT